MRYAVKGLFITCLIGLAGLSGGCAVSNTPLNSLNTPPDQWTHNHTRATVRLDPSDPSTGYFVGLAISGGGSRSANFSAACMLELQRAGVLQRVNYISAVSGGSLTAAWYCVASDDEWNPEQAQQLLTHPFASDALHTLFAPWTVAALMTSDYDSSDIIAGTFTRDLFTRKGRGLTFADLRHDRPHLLINSTDLQSGNRYVFTDDAFDALNSNLSKFPLGYACAASSAVPVVMHYVTVRDYTTSFKMYRHFVDGGITDNLGVQSLLEVYDDQMRTAQTENKPLPYPKGAIIIVLDAKTKFNADLAQERTTTFLEALSVGVSLASTNLLTSASSKTMADLIVKYSADNVTADTLRKEREELEDTGYLETKDQRERSVRILHVDLSRVARLKNLPYSDFGQSINAIDTYFNISQKDAYNLYEAAHLLLSDPDTQAHLQAIKSDLSGK